MIVEEKKTGRKKWKFLLIVVLIIITGGVFTKFFMQVKHIPSGYVGIKSSIGNPFDNSVDYDIKLIKGYVLFMPLYSEITTYPTSIQTVAYDSIRINAQDGTEFTVRPRISYLLEESKVILFYKNNKQSLNKVNESYLKEIIASSYNTAAGSFSSDSLVSNKNTLETEVNRILTSKMNEIGLTLKNINSNLEIPQKIKNIIELRSQVLQNAILADDKKKQAEAEAQIQLIEARTRSTEDSLKNSAMTHLAIQKMFIEKWDGKLPVYGETPRIYKNITD